MRVQRGEKSRTARAKDQDVGLAANNLSHALTPSRASAAARLAATFACTTS